MNYIVAKCPKCDMWQITTTQKPKYWAIFRCKFCNTTKNLYNHKTGFWHTASDLKFVYFGSDYYKAKHLLKKYKVGL